MTLCEEGEVLCRGEERFWSSNDEFCFIAVEFQEVYVHPDFDVSQVVCDGGENDRDDGCGRDVQLCVVSVTVKMKSMAANGVSKG